MNMFECKNGFIVKIHSVFKDPFLMLDNGEKVLRNFMYSISKDEQYAEKFITYLEFRIDDNKVEHLL